MSVRCRLVRADGSTWRVKELREGEDGVRASGLPNGDGGPTAAGGNGRRSVLEDEPLLRGDRIEWVRDDGEVLWSLKMPVGAAADAPDSTNAPADEGPSGESRQETAAR